MHSEAITIINEQHLSDLFEEMDYQHQFADVDMHLKILFSAYNGFYSFYKKCLLDSKIKVPAKYFYNHAHKSLILIKFFQLTAQSSASHWINCSSGDFFPRLFCTLIKSNNPDFQGDGFHHFNASSLESSLLGHDMMIKVNIETNDLCFSHGDISEKATLLQEEDTNHEVYGLLWGEYPQAKRYEGTAEEFCDTCSVTRPSFVNLDVKNFEYAKTLIQYFYPKLAERGVIMLSNFGSPYYPGPRVAWEKYFDEQQIPYAILDCGSAIIIK